MKHKFLIKFKNTIPLTKNKDNNLIYTLSYLKNKRLTPVTVLIKTYEKVGPSAALLPYVRAGRVHYVPGKIKYLSAMYKGLKWSLEVIKPTNPMTYTKRISKEIKNIIKNNGGSINQKHLFIKELIAARLNYRRRRYFNKFLRKRTYRRLHNRKNELLKKKYKKLKINLTKDVFYYIKHKKKKKLRYKRKIYKIKKRKRKNKKFFKMKKQKINKKKRKKTYLKNFKLWRKGLFITRKKRILKKAWRRIIKKESIIQL